MTTLTKTTLPFAAVALLAATSASQAAVVNVDFNGHQAPQSTNDYTGVDANGPIASDNTWNYIDTTGTAGAYTAGGLTFTLGTGWLAYSAQGGAINNLSGDRIYTTSTATMTISGLVDGGTYNLALLNALGSVTHASWDATIGMDTKSVSAASSAPGTGNGALTFTDGVTHALFSDVVATGGSITFTADYTGASGGAAALAGLQIEAVPEPSTTALLGLGGFALIFRRRK